MTANMARGVMTSFAATGAGPEGTTATGGALKRTGGRKMSMRYFFFPFFADTLHAVPISFFATRTALIAG